MTSFTNSAVGTGLTEELIYQMVISHPSEVWKQRKNEHRKGSGTDTQSHNINSTAWWLNCNVTVKLFLNLAAVSKQVKRKFIQYIIKKTLMC